MYENGPITLAARILSGVYQDWWLTDRKLGSDVWGLVPSADVLLQTFAPLIFSGGNPTLPFPYGLHVESDSM